MSDYSKYFNGRRRKKAIKTELLWSSPPPEVAVAQCHHIGFYSQASLRLRGSQFNTITPFKEHLKAWSV